MKNIHNWLLVIFVISFLIVIACNSPVNKQAREESIESVEEFDEDSTSYSEDTTVTDDEGVMEDVEEEEEEE